MKNWSLAGLAQAARWHRTGLALLALFVALVAGLSALLPGTAAGTSVVVAARALDAGSAIAQADVKVITVAADAVPDGAFTSVDAVVGRTLCVGLTRGTPITSAALTTDSLADRSAGEVLVPLRVRDAGVVALLHVGDMLTIVTSTAEGVTRTVAQHVRVAQLPTAATSSSWLSTSGTTGALIVVAATVDVAADLAATADQWLGVVIE